MTKKVRVFSPLGFLALTACGGENTSTSTGYAVKGPLSNALVFADANGNGIFDAGETSTRTDASGGYSLSNPNAYSIVVVTDDQTIDTSTGQVLSGLVMKGSANSGVITPLTGLANSGIDTRALAKVLGLDPNTDFNTFNPYADGVNSAAALAYEKASQQVVGAAQVIAATLEKSGEANSGESLMKAFTKISDQITKVANGTASKDTLVADAVNASSTQLSAADKQAIAQQIDQMFTEISEVTSLTGDAAKNAFGTGSALSKVYSEEGIQAGNTANVTQLAENAAPTDLALGKVSITEGASNLSLGKIAVTDDAGTSQAFAFALSGADSAKFKVVNGELFLKNIADYEAQSSYSLKIAVTDAGKKTYSEDFRISVTGVNEATVQTSDLNTAGFARAGDQLGVDVGSALFAHFSDADNAIAGKSASAFASSSIQWLVDGVEVSGATSKHFTPLDEHIGKTLSVRHTLVDQQGNSSSFSQDIGTVLPASDDIPFTIDFFAGAQNKLQTAVEGLSSLGSNLGSIESNSLLKFLEFADIVANQGMELFFGDNLDGSGDANYAHIQFDNGYNIGLYFDGLNQTSLQGLFDSIGSAENVDPFDPDTWAIAGGINAISFRTDEGSMLKFEFDAGGYGGSNPQDVFRIIDFTATGDQIRDIGLYGNFDNAMTVIGQNVQDVLNSMGSPDTLVDFLELLQASQDINGVYFGTANNETNKENSLIQIEFDRDNTTSLAGPDEVYARFGDLSISLVGDFGDTLPELADIILTATSVDLSSEQGVSVLANALSENNFNYLTYADIKVANQTVMRLRVSDPESFDAALFNSIDFDGENVISYEHDGATVYEYIDNDGLYALIGDGAEIDAFLHPDALV